MNKHRSPGRRMIETFVAGTIAASPVTESEAAQKKRVTPPPAIETNQEKAHLDAIADPLSLKEIDHDRDNAISNLLSSLPPDKRLDYLRAGDRLRAESQMYSPDGVERARLAKNYSRELQILLDRTKPDSYGLFALAESDSSGLEIHRLYVLLRPPFGKTRFIKAYRISMGEAGFGNEPDSGKTPLGLTSIKSVLRGLYGEVIPARPDSLAYFKTIVRGKDGKMHRFASDFGHQNILEPAAIITDRYTVDERRGIHFHGSNRTGRWRDQSGSRVWETFLDAKRKSGACGRMANADVRDLGRYIRVGTQVYIHASEEILHRQR